MIVSLIHILLSLLSIRSEWKVREKHSKHLTTFQSESIVYDNQSLNDWFTKYISGSLDKSRNFYLSKSNADTHLMQTSSYLHQGSDIDRSLCELSTSGWRFQSCFKRFYSHTIFQVFFYVHPQQISGAWHLESNNWLYSCFHIINLQTRIFSILWLKPTKYY